MSHGPRPGREALVTSEAELTKLIDSAREQKAISLDTEFMREKTYRARLCLVQVATEDHISLIDPLSEMDLQPVAGLLADPDVEVLLHAGKQDLDIFYERFGVVPRRVFDVQVAASFAGLGASLPYGRLVEQVVGVPLEKGESYTDWCRRPLTQAQLRYAADDVRYLHVIADKLKARLEELGRLSWVEEEMKGLEREETYKLAPEDAWRKVSGRGALNPKQLSVLRELAAWREELASSRDLPRGWIVKDPTLVDLARRSPRDLGELSAIRGLNAREAERTGREMIEAIRRGRSAAPMPSSPSPPRAAQNRARMIVGLADAIVRARCERASISTEAVTTRGELESVLADVFAGRVEEGSHRLLQGWRRELAGEAVLKLARGELGIRVVDNPPYVEEVEV